MKSKTDILPLLTIKHFNVKATTNYLLANRQLIGDFVVYSLENEPFSWRASWVLCKYAEKNAADIQPYAQMIAENLPNITKHGHIRETLKILYHLQLDEKLTCDILDICFRCVKDNKLQSSTKSAAFDFILKVGQSYPELQSEAQTIFSDTKDYYPHGMRKSIEVKTMHASSQKVKMLRATSHNKTEKIISQC
ncbi:MAG: hypothetical protein J6T63_04120 [Bacteroidales bacterium]|nr:hypothetical protein [Bacteroidales bacterium]